MENNVKELIKCSNNRTALESQIIKFARAGQINKVTSLSILLHEEMLKIRQLNLILKNK